MKKSTYSILANIPGVRGIVDTAIGTPTFFCSPARDSNAFDDFFSYMQKNYPDEIPTKRRYKEFCATKRR